MEFITIIQEAFTSVNRVKGVLARALVLHLLIFLSLEVVAYYTELSQAAEIGVAVIGSFVYILVAITTHRILLLGPGSVPGHGVIGFSMRELRYVMYVIGISLIVIPGLLLHFIPLLGAVFFFVFLAWIWGRSALVFPGVALNEEFYLQNSWDKTKGYNFMMAMVVTIYPVLLKMPAYFIEDIQYGSFINVFLNMVATVLEVSALSMAYKYFVIEPRDIDKQLDAESSLG